MRVVLATLFLATGCAMHTAPQPGRDARPAAAWTEAVAGNTFEARVVLPGAAACPTATIDGRPVAMTSRGAPTEAFPITVCTAALPEGATATVAGLALPTTIPVVRRIVVIGDTGCRLKGAQVQDCADPTAWPFATVAARAAARHPDLVIHVGDYHYRESPCPSGMACAASPYGDRWAVWDADFFTPAAPLLAAAPWILVRGNHESCGRAGTGWTRLLDAQPDGAACAGITPGYAVRTGGLDLRVYDSADADPKATARIGAYRQTMTALLADAGPGSWLLTHRPVWAIAAAEPGPTDAALFENPIEQAAIRDVPGLERLALVLSGHVHLFASYDFGMQRPAQLVVGDGGDLLDRPAVDSARPVIDGLRARAALIRSTFGYLVLDRAGSGWSGTLYAVDDRVLARCTLSGRSLACTPAADDGQG